MDLESIKKELEIIEKEYCEKLQKAKMGENYDKIQMLFYELNFRRKFYNKKIMFHERKRKYIEKKSGNKKMIF